MKHNERSSGGPRGDQGGLVRFLSADEVRGRRTAKWTLYQPDVLPMPVAEMDVAPAEPIARVLTAAIERGELGYPPMDGGYLDAFAQFARQRWAWRVEPGALVPFVDTGVAMAELVRSVAPPGPVIVSPPVYDGFFQWPTSAGRERVDVPLLREREGDLDRYRLDLAGIDEAFAAGARAYLLCNPQNPVGMVPSRADLTALASIAHRHGGVVISDEVHAPLVFASSQSCGDRDASGPKSAESADGAGPFVPFLTASHLASEVGIAVHAPSKAWNVAGLKFALAVVENDRLQRRLTDLQQAGSWNVGVLGALAAEVAYREGGPWLDELLAALRRKHAFLRDALAAGLPGARGTASEFGYLAWLDLSELGWPQDAAGVALQHGRVALGVGAAFGHGWDQHVRINLGTSDELLRVGVARLLTAHHTVSGSRR